MDKLLTVHLGTHKTGTTMVQQACHRHRGLLESAGVCYPEVGIIDGAHHALGGSLLHDLHLGVFPTAAPRAYERIDEVPVWRELGDLLAASTCERFLVSSEEFEWLTQPQVIAGYLRQRVPGLRLQALVWVRRQDSYLESFYQQLVKDHNIRLAAPFAAWLGEPGFIFYDALVERWETAFGPGSVTLRLFEDDRDALLENFLEALGLPRTLAAQLRIDRADPVLRAKASIDARCVEFLRLCNGEPLPRERHERILDALLVANARIAAREGRLSTRLMNLPLRARILHDVAESNARVKAQFFPGRRSLFAVSDLDSQEPLLAVNEIVPDLVSMGLF